MFNEYGRLTFGVNCTTMSTYPTTPPPAISATDPGGSDYEATIDGTESGGARSRGRRRRPGRARVRLQENPGSELPSDKDEQSSDLLHPQTLAFIEPSSPTHSKIGGAKGSFKNLVTKVSAKIQPTKKQGKN